MPAHPAWRRNVQRSLRGPSATWPKASCGSNPGVFSLRAWLTKAVLRLLYSPYVYTLTFLVSTRPLWGQRPETISSPTPKNHASSNSLARSPVALRNRLYGQPNTGTHVLGDARCVTVLRRSCRAQERCTGDCEGNSVPSKTCVDEPSVACCDEKLQYTGPRSFAGCQLRRSVSLLRGR
jgi:hypothetical protein